MNMTSIISQLTPKDHYFWAPHPYGHKKLRQNLIEAVFLNEHDTREDGVVHLFDHQLGNCRVNTTFLEHFVANLLDYNPTTRIFDSVQLTEEESDTLLLMINKIVDGNEICKKQIAAEDADRKYEVF